MKKGWGAQRVVFASSQRYLQSTIWHVYIYTRIECPLVHHLDGKRKHACRVYFNRSGIQKLVFAIKKEAKQSIVFFC